MSDQHLVWLCSAVTLQSDSRGFFQEFAENVAASVSQEWLATFGRLAIDKERVLHCYNDPQIKTLVRGTLGNVQKIFRGKCAPFSKTKRDEAEQFLRRGNHDRAVVLANLSVARAPFPDVDKTVENGLSLPFSLWTRSKAFQEMGKHRLALTDIQLALKNKLPDELKLEAYERLSDCFLKLGLKKQAEIALNIVVNIAKIKGNKESEDRHEAILRDIDSSLSQEEDTKGAELPDLHDGESRAMPYLSSTLSMKRAKEKGRYLIANAAIKTGATLAVEEPYSSVLRFEKNGTHCLNCFKRLETVIPCRNCSGVAFCSEDCQISSVQYHQWECPYLELMIGSGMSVLCQLSLRIISQSNVLFFLDMVKAIRENLDHPYLQVYNMETHCKGREPKDFLYRTLMALFLLEILRQGGYFKQYGTNNPDNLSEAEVTVGCLLLRQLQLTQYNVHEIYETLVMPEGKPWNLKDSKAHYIGVGIYPSSSMFNHGCNPTLARYFIGKNLVLKTARPIMQGEEVTENYGLPSTRKNFQERKRTLLARYRFDCSCTACKEDWPTITEMDIKKIKLKCLRTPCAGVFDYKEGDPVAKLKCPLCRQQNDLNVQLEKCAKLKSDFDKATHLMDKLEVEEAVQAFTTFLDAATNIVAQPNKYLCLAMESLQTCLAYTYNFYTL